MENSEILKTGRPPGSGGVSKRQRTSTLPRASLWPRKTRRLLLGAAAAAAATSAAFLVDCPLSSWCLGAGCPDCVRSLLEVAGPFGHGLGVVLIAMAIYQLDPRRRPLLARVLVMALGAGLLADGLKLLVARARPLAFSFQGGVAATFGGWLPLWHGGPDGQSFPSAHTATAVGLAMALAWLYPRGRWLFTTLAALVACQRIVSGCHFLSDTIFGAAVGMLVAEGCLRNARIAQGFGQLEAFFRARQARAAGYRPWKPASNKQPPSSHSPRRRSRLLTIRR